MGCLEQLIYSYPSASEVLSAATVLPILGILSVGARFAARAKQKTRVGKDDAAIVMALVCVILMGVLIAYGNIKGAYGYPTPPGSFNGPLSNRDELQPSFLAFQLGYWILIVTVLAFGLIRLSVLFFYRRLFIVNRGTAFDIISKILLYVVVIWTLCFFFLLIFYCGLNFPNKYAPAGGFGPHCLVVVELYLSFSVTDLTLDIIIWILPMPTIWKLRTSKTRKLLITGVFLLASMSLIAALLRMIIQIENYIADPIGPGSTRPTADIDVTVSIYWSMIEAGVGLIASCIPIIHVFASKSFLQSIFNRFRKSSSSSSAKRSSLLRPSYYKQQSDTVPSTTGMRSKENYSRIDSVPQQSRELEVLDVNSRPTIPARAYGNSAGWQRRSESNWV